MLSADDADIAKMASGVLISGEAHRSSAPISDLEELRINIEIVLEQVKGMTATPRTKQLKASEPALFDEPQPRRLRTTRKPKAE